MYKAIYTVLLLFCCTVGMGQQIRGTVRDSTTKRPIAGATVFINNTTVGTSTTDNGVFSFGVYPVGKVEVVVTALGYQTVVFERYAAQSGDIDIDALLSPKLFEIDEVVVTPFEKDGWAKWGKLFRDIFIGTTPNADKTILINPDVLKFRYDKRSSTLEAVASEPIMVENKALGYRIQYQLEVFRVDFKNRTNYVAGYPFYSEIKGTTRKHKQYERARAACYESSLLRFMRSLYVDSLVERGYEVRRMTRSPNLEKQRVRILMRNNAISGNRISTAPITIADTVIMDTIRMKGIEDSMAYYRNVMAQDDFIVEFSPWRLTADSVLTPGRDDQKILSFDNYLFIQKLNLKKSPKYMADTGDNGPPQTPVSWLVMDDEKYIHIEPNGHYTPPTNLFTALYWAWLGKIADLLPLDYMPPSSPDL